MPPDSDLRYPVGQCTAEGPYNEAQRTANLASIEKAPARLREAAAELTDAQLDTPYRPEGWSVRQVVNHLADSHLVVYERFKRALTEENPVVGHYDRAGWVSLSDVRSGQIAPALDLFHSVHRRWAVLMHSMSVADFLRTFVHPERGCITLEHYLARMEWHGRHHTAHITSLRQRMGWR